MACVSAEQSGNIRRDGAGSLSSLAPLPMYFGRHIDQAMGAGGLSALVTPAKRNAQDACRYLGGLLVGAFLGDAKTRLLSPYYPSKSFWDDPILDKQIVEIAAGSFKRRAPPASTQNWRRLGGADGSVVGLLDIRRFQIGSNQGGRTRRRCRCHGINLWTDCRSILRNRRDSNRVARTMSPSLVLLCGKPAHEHYSSSELARLDVWW